MNINFSHTHGASDWLHEKKANLFYSISNGYPKEQEYSFYEYENVVGTKWTYLSGFPKGAYCALLSIAARITAVGESFVKGVGNVFGSPFSKKFSVSTGLKQLGVELPLSIFKLIFLMPVEVIADAVISPFAVMIDKNYAEARVEFEAKFISRTPDPRSGNEENYSFFNEEILNIEDDQI